MTRFFLFFTLLAASVSSYAQTFRPDSDTLKKLELDFPAWKRTASCSWTLKRGMPIRSAWRVTLERPIAARADGNGKTSRKGVILIYLLPQDDSRLPEGKAFSMLNAFDWNTPVNDLEQYEMYLGTGRGYHWFAKTDIGRLNFLRERMKLSGGEDMNRKMAEALNEEDFELYTSRTAVEYFRGKGDTAVQAILHDMKEWEQEKGAEVPIPHILALKLAGGEKASEALLDLAYSKKRATAEYAIGVLLAEPCTAPDRFCRTALRLPAFTERALNVFRTRKAGRSILDDLRKIAARPKTLLQYSLVIAALREFSGGDGSLPEYDAANHIMIRIMRHGDTSDSTKFITFENTDLISENDMEARERKRTEPFVRQLLQSRDKEAAVVAALSLAAYEPPPKSVSDEYARRVRKAGMELLRKMPAGQVQDTLRLLAASITDARDRNALARVIAELRLRL